MKKIQAKNLEEALIQASLEFECSVTELQYEVVQYSRKGIFGIGKRDTIILAYVRDRAEQKKDLTEQKGGDLKESYCLEIQKELKELLAFMPYEIDRIEVSMFDERTVFIFLDGRDSALLIGEKGYRYKAFSYLLFHWIYPKYGFGVRLEVAQFLKMQEELVQQYIQEIMPHIEQTQSFKTKNLSGILGIIAQRKLKELYPNKRVILKVEGEEQYIYIGD
ncbi:MULTISPECIES: Jag N-terminal domain-containing protein [unclassified Helicobacter]|uniref:Jag N-terminal domain-containing protein n=1 Tax=unclassified Helicobacter TaxID=2593540 RepID=UPI000CF03ABD|nr:MULTISPECIES: Jag N-terminal domain-containing protein [unclassified Helicobacter]